MSDQETKKGGAAAGTEGSRARSEREADLKRFAFCFLRAKGSQQRGFREGNT